MRANIQNKIGSDMKEAAEIYLGMYNDDQQWLQYHFHHIQEPCSLWVIV